MQGAIFMLGLLISTAIGVYASDGLKEKRQVMPGIPQIPAFPELLGMSQIPGMREYRRMPQISGMPVNPGMPQIPGILQFQGLAGSPIRNMPEGVRLIKRQIPGFPDQYQDKYGSSFISREISKKREKRTLGLSLIPGRLSGLAQVPGMVGLPAMSPNMGGMSGYPQMAGMAPMPGYLR